MSNSKIQALVEELLVGLEVKKNPSQYHLNSIIYIIKYSGLFNEFLVDQLIYNLEKKGQLITKEELVSQFSDPNLSKYKPEDYNEIYDFLRGEKDDIDLDDLMGQEKDRQKEKVQSKLSQKTIDRELMKEIFMSAHKI